MFEKKKTLGLGICDICKKHKLLIKENLKKICRECKELEQNK